MNKLTHELISALLVTQVQTHGLLNELLTKNRHETIEDTGRGQESLKVFVFGSFFRLEQLIQNDAQILLNGHK